MVSDLTPVLVPAHIRHEFLGYSDEVRKQMVQDIYVRCSTDAPRAEVIQYMTDAYWSPEAAAWLYSQVKAKGNRIQFVFDGPQDEALSPETADDFRRLAISGLVLMAVGLVLGLVLFQGQTGIVATKTVGLMASVGLGMFLTGMTRDWKRRR